MKTFGSNDTVFARAMMMGTEMLNVRISGISSKQALMDAVRHHMGGFNGIVSLSVRNLTQGWAATQYCHFA